MFLQLTMLMKKDAHEPNSLSNIFVESILKILKFTD